MAKAKAEWCLVVSGVWWVHISNTSKLLRELSVGLIPSNLCPISALELNAASNTWDMIL